MGPKLFLMFLGEELHMGDSNDPGKDICHQLSCGASDLDANEFFYACLLQNLQIAYVENTGFKMDHASSKDEDSSVHLQISELKRLSDIYSQNATIFEPENNSIGESSSETPAGDRSAGPSIPEPEKKLTLFALRLAILEKAATGLGTLGFIWATVVLLGGFAVTLDKTDFWIITVILLTEGTRIFSRSHELEWQRQSTWSLTGAGINSFRLLKLGLDKVWVAVISVFRVRSSDGSRVGASREERQQKVDKQSLPAQRWASSDVPLLLYAACLFLSRNISKILQCLQILAATACVALSAMKLNRHNFGEIAKGDSDKRNRKDALMIFYGLALAEASLFLLEKIYWDLKVASSKILEQVNEECEFGSSGIVLVRRFFYDAYSRCVDGSVFDGLKMDMVSFSMELLASNSLEEQLMGVRSLQSFSTSKRFSDETLQKIGATFSAVERLVEMLNWKGTQEEEIRQSAAEILSKLAGKKQNSLRVAEIPGSLESISSLLYVNKTYSSAIDEISEKSINADHEHYGFWTFNHLGLLILKKLARDHDNCGKIGNIRGLLPKIIDFTCAKERLLTDDHVVEPQILTVKRSLEVIKMLASTTDSTGKQLRKEISEIVFTYSNIRGILRHGEKYPDLQKLGIETLTSLAMDDDAKEKIGGTGGILKELFNIFVKDRMPTDEIIEVHVRTAAGEAIAMLTLDSKENCNRIMKLGSLDKLVKELEVPLARLNAARILRNLCSYSVEDCFQELKGFTTAVPSVLNGILSEDDKLREVMVGLAARSFKLMTYPESSIMFEKAGIKEPKIASVLVQILKKHTYPPARFPSIRRFTIEFAIWLMRDKASNVQIFRTLGLKKELENVLYTTSELESFNIFSGTVGLSRYKTSMQSLVETAQNLLSNE